MSTTRIRFLGLTVGLVMFATVGGGGLWCASGTCATESKDAKLKQLLNERLDVLRQIVAQMEELHKLRVTGLKDLYAARVAMHRAKLDLCTTDQDRIEVLEDLLNEAKRREQTEKSSSKPATLGIGQLASSLPIEEAQVDRLNIEIELERLKLK